MNRESFQGKLFAFLFAVVMTPLALFLAALAVRLLWWAISSDSVSPFSFHCPRCGLGG